MGVIDTRRLATITTKGDWHAFAVDDAGFSYFVYYRALQSSGRYTWDDLQIGSRIRMTVIEHPKGARGIEVEIVSC